MRAKRKRKIVERVYPFTTKCTNCGYQNGMATNDKNLSCIVCWKCEKVGTTIYLKRSKKMKVKKKTKKKTAKKIVKKTTKKKTIKKKTTKKKTASARVLGKTSGVGVMATWVEAFQHNNKVPVNKRWNDKQIASYMKKEFPGRKSAIFDHVQLVRNRYNKGALTKGITPKRKSARHGD